MLKGEMERFETRGLDLKLSNPHQTFLKTKDALGLDYVYER